MNEYLYSYQENTYLDLCMLSQLISNSWSHQWTPSLVTLISDWVNLFLLPVKRVSLCGREVLASFGKVKGRSTKKGNIDVCYVCAIFKISIFKFERKYLYSFYDMDLLVKLLNIAKQDMLWHQWYKGQEWCAFVAMVLYKLLWYLDVYEFNEWWFINVFVCRLCIVTCRLVLIDG